MSQLFLWSLIFFRGSRCLLPLLLQLLLLVLLALIYLILLFLFQFLLQPLLLLLLLFVILHHALVRVVVARRVVVLLHVLLREAQSWEHLVNAVSQLVDLLPVHLTLVVVELVSDWIMLGTDEDRRLGLTEGQSVNVLFAWYLELDWYELFGLVNLLASFG